METQAAFLDKTLGPLLESARSGAGHVFFVDAAHFVQGVFLHGLWCACRLFIRGASGRQRYSVLGAWNAVSNTLVSVTTAGTVSSDTMCELLHIPHAVMNEASGAGDVSPLKPRPIAIQPNSGDSRPPLRKASNLTARGVIA